uniref:Uncharacterized protein n=1 Tax=Rhizophora mucronata TaxID=61149 RepID=A0A2P2P6G0_RHIMU
MSCPPRGCCCYCGCSNICHTKSRIHMPTQRTPLGRCWRICQTFQICIGPKGSCKACCSIGCGILHQSRHNKI